jgi:glyoxylase-like metal-dependent hydrolase (beta-lactamase superfamily II)
MADSVFPIVDQMELWSGDLQISESLRLRPAAGHTPGSSVLWLEAGRPAVFVGDLTHCPIQIPRPGDPCRFDVDPAAAAVTRKRVFTEAARSRAVVIPAHYPGHGGATVVARGDRFEVEDWLEFAKV